MLQIVKAPLEAESFVSFKFMGFSGHFWKNWEFHKLFASLFRRIDELEKECEKLKKERDTAKRKVTVSTHVILLRTIFLSFCFYTLFSAILRDVIEVILCLLVKYEYERYEEYGKRNKQSFLQLLHNKVTPKID